MALFKVNLKEGGSETIVARDYFELEGYTIFQTEKVKEIAIQTKLIEKIEDITGNSGQFEPQVIHPSE